MTWMPLRTLSRDRFVRGVRLAHRVTKVLSHGRETWWPRVCLVIEAHQVTGGGASAWGGGRDLDKSWSNLDKHCSIL